MKISRFLVVAAALASLLQASSVFASDKSFECSGDTLGKNGKNGTVHLDLGASHARQIKGWPGDPVIDGVIDIPHFKFTDSSGNSPLEASNGWAIPDGSSSTHYKIATSLDSLTLVMPEPAKRVVPFVVYFGGTQLTCVKPPSQKAEHATVFYPKNTLPSTELNGQIRDGAGVGGQS